jgi:hypothetical protein
MEGATSFSLLLFVKNPRPSAVNNSFCSLLLSNNQQQETRITGENNGD